MWTVYFSLPVWGCDEWQHVIGWVTAVPWLGIIYQSLYVWRNSCCTTSSLLLRFGQVPWPVQPVSPSSMSCSVENSHMPGGAFQFHPSSLQWDRLTLNAYLCLCGFLNRTLLKLKYEVLDLFMFKFRGIAYRRDQVSSQSHGRTGQRSLQVINMDQFWYETTVCTSLNVFLFLKAQIKNSYIKL